MKVGDLVKWTDGHGEEFYALVVKRDGWATLIKWTSSGEVEDADYYIESDVAENEVWEVISEAR